VGRLLQKLGARDRVQLVIFAYENRLLPAGGGSERGNGRGVSDPAR
jgi:hypothetical protein